jgi:hypothetical protein
MVYPSTGSRFWTVYATPNEGGSDRLRNSRRTVRDNGLYGVRVAGFDNSSYRAHNRRARRAVRTLIGHTAIGIALLPLLAPGAWSRPMRMMESFPAAQAIVDGNNLQYVVRFDGLVDHRASRIWITQGDRIVRTLTPLLNSAPTVLFASSSRLPPGNYQLHWSAKSMPDGDLTDGTIEFSCGK